MSIQRRLVSRRNFSKLTLSSLFIPTTLLPIPSTAQGEPNGDKTQREVSPDQWMASWNTDPVKKLLGPLDVRRFSDPIYILLKSVGWKDLSPQASLPPVTVPQGFVTDFASVPRPFWWLFRPDGNYAYAAVIHDYLYWEQPIERSTADRIFRTVMTELKVTDRAAETLYKAVDEFGQSAWDSNRKLRSMGEQRILKKIPEDPAITWKEWKSKPGVFDRS